MVLLKLFNNKARVVYSILFNQLSTLGGYSLTATFRETLLFSGLFLQCKSYEVWVVYSIFLYSSNRPWRFNISIRRLRSLYRHC
jgi:hypothetical protein